MNFAKNVCEEKVSLNAILVRSDDKKVSQPISEWVVTVVTWGIEVRTRMVLGDQK